MGYLDKNINMTLVILVVGIVILMLGVTVFFQVGLKARTSDLDATSGNLSTCTTQLTNYQDRLEQCNEKTQSAIADIESYDKIYEQKLAELSTAESDLSVAERRATNLELIKASLEKEKSDLKTEEKKLQDTITQLNSRITDLTNDVSTWRGRFNCCEGSATIGDCQTSC